jgi:hypothetical protein
MQCQPDHTSQDLYLAPMDTMSELGFDAIPDFDFDAPNDIVADSLSGLDQSHSHYSGTDPLGTLWTLSGVTSVLPEALQNLPFQVFQNNLRNKGTCRCVSFITSYRLVFPTMKNYTGRSLLTFKALT